MKKFYKVKQEELLKYSDLFKEDDVILPKRQTVGSCGYDFYMPYDYVLKANSNGKVYSGIKIELGFDEFLMLCIRSSLAIKKGITLTNQVGIIDSDYFNNIDNRHEYEKVIYEAYITNGKFKLGKRQLNKAYKIYKENKTY